ncbi:MOSC domain-containing protein [Roseibium algae]|uniref:MOSC domain-containing protein n=1 Tax=Roseibium algae TaxID=3123038 RepID=A0ABU8TGD5_9HYPH
MALLNVTVGGLFCGSVAELWPGRPTSGIQKDPVSGPQHLGLEGFDRDAQADLSVHGGPDKALHHYPAEHYLLWQAEGLMEAGTQPAAFGENISTEGMTEETACIGDIFTLGSATVQISQGRQPCWKLNAHTGHDTMAYLFQKTGRTGWYYRVLVPGKVEVGDPLTLLERLHPDLSVEMVTRARLTKKIASADAVRLSEIPELAENWRAAFGKMAAGNLNENTSARLTGKS